MEASYSYCSMSGALPMSSCTANPDWDPGDSTLGEFHCLPWHFTLPCPDPHLQFETERTLLGLAFVRCWGPPKVITAAGKAALRPLSQPICACKILHPWSVLVNEISDPRAIEPHLHSLLCLCGTYTKFGEFSSKWLLVLKCRICFLNISLNPRYLHQAHWNPCAQIQG